MKAAPPNAPAPSAVAPLSGVGKALLFAKRQPSAVKKPLELQTRSNKEGGMGGVFTETERKIEQNSEGSGVESKVR